MSHHPKSLWGIIKRAVKDIEILGNLEFHNGAWDIIKRMEREIIEYIRTVEIEPLKQDNDVLRYKVHRYEQFLKAQGFNVTDSIEIICTTNDNEAQP